jgi:hypothetical protein
MSGFLIFRYVRLGANLGNGIFFSANGWLVDRVEVPLTVLAHLAALQRRARVGNQARVAQTA